MKLRNFMATDFRDKSKGDTLPALLAERCKEGHVLTIANSLVLNILATDWFQKTQYQYFVVDKNSTHLDEIRDLVAIADKSETVEQLRAGIVETFDEASAAALEKKGLITAAVLKGLKPNNRLILICHDLSAPTLPKKIAKKKNQGEFSLLYLSNVEFYIGNKVFGNPDSSKAEYGKNMRALIGPKTSVFRGSSVIMTESIGAAPAGWCE